jgi:hypothetical protein
MNVTWRYEAAFAAPIPRPLTADELAASLESPPARAATRYLDAARAANMESFLATIAADRVASFRGAAGRTLLDALRRDLMADSRVVRLEPQANGTVLAKVEGHQDGVVIGHTLTMVLESGEWKVGR